MKNYINRFLLWLFLLPAGVYQKFGVDIPHLKAILVAKLTIDDRTATGLYKARSGSKDSDASFATLFTMVISLVMGLIFLFVFAYEDDLTRMTMFFTLYGFMLAMFLITDFSHILIDVKDNYIILPKPVSSQTFLMARMLHIVIHLMKILVPLSLPGWIAIWISRGIWGAVVFIPVLILLTMLTFALVNAVYLLIMRVFSPARINSIITSVQIGFSILLYGSFQLLPRIINESVIDQVNLRSIEMMWIFPSFWMAAGWLYFYSFARDSTLIIGAVVTVIAPLLGVWVMIRFLAPAFFRKLSMISAGKREEATIDAGIVKAKRKDTGFLEPLSRIFTSVGVEREAFLFTWRMMGRVREFKMKVYPQIGYLIVLFLMMVIGNSDKFDIEELALHTSKIKLLILSVIYLSCIIYIGAIFQMPYYDNFKASWVYFSAPLSRPGPILRGALKASLIRFFAPVVVLLMIMGVALFGIGMMPNLVCGLSNVFLISTLYSWVVIDRLPFSVSSKMASQGGTTFRTVFILIALPLFGAPHYFLFDYPLVLYCISVVTFSAGFFVLSYTKSVSWEYLNDGVDV